MVISMVKKSKKRNKEIGLLVVLVAALLVMDALVFLQFTLNDDETQGLGETLSGQVIDGGQEDTWPEGAEERSPARRGDRSYSMSSGGGNDDGSGSDSSGADDDSDGGSQGSSQGDGGDQGDSGQGDDDQGPGGSGDEDGGDGDGDDDPDEGTGETWSFSAGVGGVS